MHDKGLNNLVKQADKKSYYAVIPAAVRYDDSLSPGTKILYGEITALCSEKGFCWASNSYFAKLYDKKPKTISRWIAQLVKAGHIKSVIDKESGNKRQLYLSPKMSIPMDKNVQQNTTDNTTKNITNNKIDSSEQDLSSEISDHDEQACWLLRRFGVDAKVAESIVFDHCTPLQSIEQTIKNGLAKAVYDEHFILEAGYIVQALNQARREGKTVGPTKTYLKLEKESKSKSMNRQWAPKSPADFQKQREQIKAALGVA